MTATNLRLRHLARLYGVMPAYRDVDENPQQATETALLRALQLLGCPIETTEQADDLVRKRRKELWDTPLPSVIVAWDGELEIPLRLPLSATKRKLHCTIELEDGGTRKWETALADLPSSRTRKIDRSTYVVKHLPADETLPSGHHRVKLALGRDEFAALVISAPRKTYSDERTDGGDAWGVFLPLYALHSERSWGAGNLSDLEKLVAWVSELGGNLVATLPLLASELEFEGDPSPYSPTSRLVWNELYIDITQATGIDECPAARDLMRSKKFQRRLERLRKNELVDYGGQWALQQEVLEQLADWFFENDSPARAEFDEFVRTHPRAEDYCRYKAVRHRQGKSWPEWPKRLRDGDVRDKDYDDATFRRYLFAQWQVHRQLHRVARKARDEDSLWYLDFPLGVGRHGYDAWRNRDLFVLDASGGAPPDEFFTKGQNWGFPPLHPQQLREDGYRYISDCMRHHFEYARILRIDHVMGLHRLYWVPEGHTGRDGVYVRYHRDELMAVLSLESHRYQARVVGENLGTVPHAVDQALEAHDLLGMYVLQFATGSRAKKAIDPAPPEAVIASLNTHDVPMFAAYWTGLEIDSRLDLGLIDEDEARLARDELVRVRRAVTAFLKKQKLLEEDVSDPRRVLRACLNYLASSHARCVLINLEDLWLETLPQNTPGTSFERPNWRRKGRFTFEDFSAFRPIRNILEEIDHRRGASR